MRIVFLLLPLALIACTQESSFAFLCEESFSSGDQRHTVKIFLHEKTGSIPDERLGGIGEDQA